MTTLSITFMFQRGHLSIVMLIDIVLSVVLLSVYVESQYAECRYSECHGADRTRQVDKLWFVKTFQGFRLG